MDPRCRPEATGQPGGLSIPFVEREDSLRRGPVVAVPMSGWDPMAARVRWGSGEKVEAVTKCLVR